MVAAAITLIGSACLCGRWDLADGVLLEEPHQRLGRGGYPVRSEHVLGDVGHQLVLGGRGEMGLAYRAAAAELIHRRLLSAQTDSQKSRTGFRFALTEGRTSGTVRVWCATTHTPTLTVPSVCRMAFRWRMTRSRPTAAARMISAVMARVTQATAGMTTVPLYLSSVRAGASRRSPRTASRRRRHHGSSGR